MGLGAGAIGTICLALAPGAVEPLHWQRAAAARHGIFAPLGLAVALLARRWLRTDGGT